MRKLTLGKTLTGGGGLVSVIALIQTSGADENTKLWGTIMVAALIVALAIAAQYGPSPGDDK